MPPSFRGSADDDHQSKDNQQASIAGEGVQTDNIHPFTDQNNVQIADGDIFTRDGKLYKRKMLEFRSRSLKQHERRYGVTKLEGLGLAWALRSFHNIIANCHRHHRPNRRPARRSTIQRPRSGLRRALSDQHPRRRRRPVRRPASITHRRRNHKQ